MPTPFIVLLTTLFGWTVWLYLAVGAFGVLAFIKVKEMVQMQIKEFKEFQDLRNKRRNDRPVKACKLKISARALWSKTRPQDVWGDADAILATLGRHPIHSC